MTFQPAATEIPLAAPRSAARSARRASLVVFATVVVAFLALAGAGCRATPSANLDSTAPTPTAAQPASMLTAATPESEPDVTTEAERGALATTPEAVLALDDAATMVLGWLDVERSPRVERSYYVTEGEIEAAKPGWTENYWCAAQEIASGEEEFPAAASPRLVAVVEASSAGLDVLHQAGQQPGGIPSGSNADVKWPNVCVPVPADRRQGVVGFFDAASGQLICAGPIGETVHDALSVLTEVGRDRLPGATPLRTTAPTPTFTPEPTGTAPPLPPLPSGATTPVPLGPGEVPAGLVEAVRDYPFVNGSRWVYESVGHINEVHWERTTYTVTVDAAWMVGPDAMVVRERGRKGQTSFRLIFPEGVTGDLRGASFATAREILAAPAPPTATPVGFPEPSIDIFLRLPLTAPVRINQLREIERQEDVDAPAGRFSSCFVVRDLVNPGNSFAAWLCPGVGYVRHDLPGCTEQSGAHMVVELTEYEIPPLETVPPGD